MKPQTSKSRLLNSPELIEKLQELNISKQDIKDMNVQEIAKVWEKLDESSNIKEVESAVTHALAKIEVYPNMSYTEQLLWNTCALAGEAGELLEAAQDHMFQSSWDYIENEWRDTLYHCIALSTVTGIVLDDKVKEYDTLDEATIALSISVARLADDVKKHTTYDTRALGDSLNNVFSNLICLGRKISQYRGCTRKETLDKMSASVRLKTNSSK